MHSRKGVSARRRAARGKGLEQNSVGVPSVFPTPLARPLLHGSSRHDRPLRSIGLAPQLQQNWRRESCLCFHPRRHLRLRTEHCVRSMLMAVRLMACVQAMQASVPLGPQVQQHKSRLCFSRCRDLRLPSMQPCVGAVSLLCLQLARWQHATRSTESSPRTAGVGMLLPSFARRG